MTRVVQLKNNVGDAGACGLGLGLKANSSLLELNLVRDFMICYIFLMLLRYVVVEDAWADACYSLSIKLETRALAGWVWG
jgi:hypothetical protein